MSRNSTKPYSACVAAQQWRPCEQVAEAPHYDERVGAEVVDEPGQLGREGFGVQYVVHGSELGHCKDHEDEAVPDTRTRKQQTDGIR